MADQFRPQPFKGNLPPDTKNCIVMTPDNNITYYCSKINAIISYGLLAGKIVQVKSIEHLYKKAQKMTKLVVNENQKSYTLGFQDGTVLRVNSADLELELSVNEGREQGYGAVTDIFAAQTILVIAYEKGHIVVMKREYNRPKFKRSNVKESN